MRFLLKYALFEFGTEEEGQGAEASLTVKVELCENNDIETTGMEEADICTDPEPDYNNIESTKDARYTEPCKTKKTCDTAEAEAAATAEDVEESEMIDFPVDREVNPITKEYNLRDVFSDESDDD